VQYQNQNIFCPESKLLGLSGGGARADCTSPEAVDLLQAADQNPSVFKGKLGIVIPPLVLTSILEADTMIPASLIPILSNKFQEFTGQALQ
jgi:hypothetical protein